MVVISHIPIGVICRMYLEVGVGSETVKYAFYSFLMKNIYLSWGTSGRLFVKSLIENDSFTRLS